MAREPEAPTEVDSVYEALLERARHAVRAGAVAEAERSAREALAHHPERADAYNLLAVIREREGRHTAAVDLLRAGIAVDPTNQVAQRNLAAFVHEGRADRMLLGDEEE